MRKRLIRKYNQLNKNFYQQISADFSDSRQYYWAGWTEILKEVEKLGKDKKELKVLDIACGNGRFASFLKDNLEKKFIYYGLDNSNGLLKLAKKSLRQNEIGGELLNFDLISNYLKNNRIEYPKGLETANLIVSFGLTHHLPSKKLRIEFLKSLRKVLDKDGLIAISNWQFANDKERFKKNILSLEKIKKNKKINILEKYKLKKLFKNLEKDDYLLDWRRFQKSDQKNVYRYSHFLNEREMKELCKKAKLKIIDSFFADGKSQRLNQYFLLKKA